MTGSPPPRCGPAPASAGEMVRYSQQLVAAAFEAENAAGQAGRDPTVLSMSGGGGCTRRAAYSIAGTPPSDPARPAEARAAVLGGYLHRVLLPRMAQVSGPGAVVEHPVTLTAAGLTLRGTLDFAQAVSAGAPVNTVWDLKTVGEWRLHGVRRIDGAYTAHWLQVMGYAWAWLQRGVDVDWVIWLYLDRASGATHVETHRFNKFAMLAVDRRLNEISWWAEHPDQAPREVATVSGRGAQYAQLRGPGLAMACDHCPWLWGCWPGATAGQVGAQQILAAEPAGVEAALKLYADAQAAESSAKKDKEFAKAVLEGTPHGAYGRYTYSHGKAGSTVDMDAVAGLYEELGRPLPKKPSTPPIKVTYTPQPTE